MVPHRDTRILFASTKEARSKHRKLSVVHVQSREDLSDT
jgi:hypothetical protein